MKDDINTETSKHEAPCYAIVCALTENLEPHLLSKYNNVFLQVNIDTSLVVTAVLVIFNLNIIIQGFISTRRRHEIDTNVFFMASYINNLPCNVLSNSSNL